MKSKSFIRNLTVHVWSDIQNTIRSKYIWPSQRKCWNCSGNFGRFSQNCKHIDLKPKQAAIRQDGLAIQIFKYLWEWRRKFHNLLHAFSWSYSLLHLYICTFIVLFSVSQPQPCFASWFVRGNLCCEDIIDHRTYST